MDIESIPNTNQQREIVTGQIKMHQTDWNTKYKGILITKKRLGISKFQFAICNQIKRKAMMLIEIAIDINYKEQKNSEEIKI